MGLIDDPAEDPSISPKQRDHKRAVREGIDERLKGGPEFLKDTLDELEYGKDYARTKRATREGVNEGIRGDGIIESAINDTLDEFAEGRSYVKHKSHFREAFSAPTNLTRSDVSHDSNSRSYGGGGGAAASSFGLLQALVTLLLLPVSFAMFALPVVIISRFLKETRHSQSHPESAGIPFRLSLVEPTEDGSNVARTILSVRKAPTRLSPFFIAMRNVPNWLTGQSFYLEIFRAKTFVSKDRYIVDAPQGTMYIRMSPLLPDGQYVARFRFPPSLPKFEGLPVAESNFVVDSEGEQTAHIPDVHCDMWGQHCVMKPIPPVRQPQTYTRGFSPESTALLDPISMSSIGFLPHGLPVYFGPKLRESCLRWTQSIDGQYRGYACVTERWVPPSSKPEVAFGFGLASALENTRWTGAIGNVPAELLIIADANGVRGEMIYGEFREYLLIQTVSNFSVVLKGTAYEVLGGSKQLFLHVFNGTLSADRNRLEGEFVDPTGFRGQWAVVRLESFQSGKPAKEEPEKELNNDRLPIAPSSVAGCASVSGIVVTLNIQGGPTDEIPEASVWGAR